MGLNLRLRIKKNAKLMIKMIEHRAPEHQNREQARPLSS
jgi:hypothetical protein